MKMGFLLVILVIIAVAAYKAVGKKLNAAGGGGMTEVFPVPDHIPEETDEPAGGPELQGFLQEDLQPEDFGQAVPEFTEDKTVGPEEKPSVAKQDKKKLDPKEMVVYSEIFRAKYLE